jgi:anti-anti-sigma regulatory factor
MTLASVGALLPTAFTIAFVGFMESIAVARALAAKEGERVDADRELAGLGLANLVAGVVAAFPVTGGFSRSAVNAQAGARSGLASVVTAGLVLLTLLLLTPAFRDLPQAVLGAIVVVAVAGLVDLREPRHLWRLRRSDGAVWGLTFAGTLLVGVETGLVVGIAVSLVWFVVRSAFPHVARVGWLATEGVWRNLLRYPEAWAPPGVEVLRFDAALYFANVGFLRDTVERTLEARPDLEGLVLDLGGAHDIDAVGVETLHQLLVDLERRGVRTAVAGPQGAGARRAGAGALERGAARAGGVAGAGARAAGVGGVAGARGAGRARGRGAGALTRVPGGVPCAPARRVPHATEGRGPARRPAPPNERTPMPEVPFPIVDVHAHFPVVNTIGREGPAPEPHPLLAAYGRDRQARMHREWATDEAEPPARTPAEIDAAADRWALELQRHRVRYLNFVTGQSNDLLAVDRAPPPRPLHRLRPPPDAAGRRRRDAPRRRRAGAARLQAARAHDRLRLRGPGPARPVGVPGRAAPAGPDPLRLPRARRRGGGAPAHEPAVALHGGARLPRDPLHRAALRRRLLARPAGAVLEPAQRLRRHLRQQPVDALDALPADARGPLPQGVRDDRPRAGPVRHRLVGLPARLRVRYLHDQLRACYTLNLPESDAAKVFGGNAARLLGLDLGAAPA